jgi:hypothetical protein
MKTSWKILICFAAASVLLLAILTAAAIWL